MENKEILQPQAAAAPINQTGAEKILHKLERTHTRLAGLVERAEKKLDPITLPDTPQNKAGLQEAQVDVPPLFVEYSAKISSMNSSIDQLDDILSRVDI